MSKHSILIYCLLLFQIFHISQSTFILPEYTLSLESSQFLYPNNTGALDIIWRFNHSIHLDISEFELDGQNGDFLLISDQPLTYSDTFDAYNNTEGLPPFLPESIVTDQGLLLSWRANATVEILNSFGTFIYFHAEDIGKPRLYPFRGFNITVQDLDELRKPPPPDDTEVTSVAPLIPGEKIYISKFLSCKEPTKFAEELEDFKEVLAKIASEYCNETEHCSDLFSGDFLPSEINIPDADGLHYCDPLWDVYDNCIEVKFAIVRYEAYAEANDTYLMPESRLEDMWTKKDQQLRSRGYCPYKPPKSLADMNAWIWMASVLGMSLFLIILMCFTWCKNTEDNHYPRDAAASELKRQEDEPPKDTIFSDLTNPIYNVIAKIRKGNNGESNYAGLGQTSSDTVVSGDGHGPANIYKPKTNTNVLFQEHEVSFEYDNQAFDKDDHGGEDFGGDVDYLYGDEEEQTYGFNGLPRDTFLRIPRGSRQEDSASEHEYNA